MEEQTHTHTRRTQHAGNKQLTLSVGVSRQESTHARGGNYSFQLFT
jgi:c-di-AMP phosphodiesterase-like protein